MTDELEDRIAGSYAHLAPEEGLRESVLGSLPRARVAPNPWRGPLLVAATVLMVAALVVIAWPGGGGGTTLELANCVGYHTDGGAYDVAAIMEKRLEALGAPRDSVLVGEEPGRIWVTMPPDLDAATVEATLLRPGTLEYRIVIENPEPGEGRRVECMDGSEALVVEEPADPADRFGGEDIDPETVGVRSAQSSGSWYVDFEIVDERSVEFESFTFRYVNRRLAIVIDGRVLAAPVIRSPLRGAGIITGGGPSGFTREAAESLAAVLISGAYPEGSRPR